MSSSASIRLEPATIEQFYVEPDRPVTFVFDAGRAAAGTTCRWAARDYVGAAWQTGVAAVDAEGRVSLTLTLPRGYHELSFPEVPAAFGVLAMPVCPGEPQPFFCVDSALTWHGGEAARRQSYIGLMRRLGLAMARERVAWTRLEPAPGRFVWDVPPGAAKPDCAFAENDQVRRQYAAARVPLLDVWHDAPAWNTGEGKGPTAPYPLDLVKAVDALGTMAERWGRSWGGVEAWNEPETHFGGDLPAEQYVTYAKALRCALDQAGRPAALVTGVFISGILDWPFRHATAASGLVGLGEVHSFHHYDLPESIEYYVDCYRQWLGANGRQALPLWLTEAGSHVTQPITRGSADATPDRTRGMILLAKVVEAYAGGVARFFAFLYAPYHEAGQDFSMTDPAGSPYRNLATYVNAARVLRGKEFIGDWPVNDSAVLKARVFTDDREAVVALFTNVVRPGAALACAVPVRRVEGADGRVLALNGDGSVPLEDGLVLVFIEPAVARAKVRTDGRALRLWGQSRPALPVPSPLPASGVIVQHVPDRAVLHPTNQRWYLRDPALAQRLPLTVRVNNLRSEALAVTVSLRNVRGELVAAAPATQLRVAGHAFVEWQPVVGTRPFVELGVARIRVRAETAPGEVLDELQVEIDIGWTLADWARLPLAQIRIPLAAVRTESGAAVPPEPGAAPASVRFSQKTPGHLQFPEAGNPAGAVALLMRVRADQPSTIRPILSFPAGRTTYACLGDVLTDRWRAVLVPLTHDWPAEMRIVLEHAGVTDMAGLARLDLTVAGTDAALAALDPRHGATVEVSDLILLRRPVAGEAEICKYKI